jgi:hypothetical protein
LTNGEQAGSATTEINTVNQFSAGAPGYLPGKFLQIGRNISFTIFVGYERTVVASTEAKWEMYVKGNF